MKAKVDQNICVGSASCITICPEVFKLVDGKSSVKVDNVPESAQDKCRQAAGECPVGAISIEE